MTSDYTQFSNLSGVYLEDSFVLGISELPRQLSFKMEAVLTPENPHYRPPNSGEQYCYAVGELVFDEVTQIEWITESPNRYTDAAGEEDLGNIDSLTKEDGSFHVEGDWGEVRIHSANEPHFDLTD
ncbi:hypothetical protein [Rhodococcus sp. USK13]|uniref:hypothetical protein n=1 Tax=Rhodococcus sp. USK13 TaxID=2806442 RepID=UPI001BCE6A06|nr:hypothetical protein [Rhodococcus sp. USK13]